MSTVCVEHAAQATGKSLASSGSTEPQAAGTCGGPDEPSSGDELELGAEASRLVPAPPLGIVAVPDNDSRHNFTDVFKEMGRFIRDKMQVEIVVDMGVPRSVTIILIFIRLNGLMLPF